MFSNNIPDVKLGIIAVSRDCFPISLSATRRQNIVKAYKSNNTKLSGIKNFPVGGIKWNKYYEILISVLEEK